jgi:hypothetical protein
MLAKSENCNIHNLHGLTIFAVGISVLLVVRPGSWTLDQKKLQSAVSSRQGWWYPADHQSGPEFPQPSSLVGGHGARGVLMGGHRPDVGMQPTLKRTSVPGGGVINFSSPLCMVDRD